MKRILLTGGGSGGHIFPLIAVVQQLKKLAQQNDIDLRGQYLGPRDFYNDYLIREGVEVRFVLGAKLRRYFSLANLIDFPKFIISIAQAFFKVLVFKPDVVFSKGGPGALPVVLVSRFLGIPVAIHESDAVPGLTNKISGRYAQKIFLAFENAKKYYSPSGVEELQKIQVVGNPVRDELLANVSYDLVLAKKQLGLAADLPLLTILGGSQGSARINQIIFDNLSSLLERYQIIHQIGANNYKNWPKEKKEHYRPLAFIEQELGQIMAASDLIISRAGAGIFEIAAFGKPAIIIPLPEAANNHQELNAIEYSKIGAAIMIKENDLSGELLLKTINKILDNVAIQRQMRQAAFGFAKPDAARVIAEYLLAM